MDDRQGHLEHAGLFFSLTHLSWTVLISCYQTFLPEGVTLLGITLSSDKTNITVMTGDWIAHLVLLSFANIHMDIRVKASNHAFILLALLPCPKFIIKDRAIRSHWGQGLKYPLGVW